MEATNTKSKRKRIVPISENLKSVLLKQKLKSGFSDYVFLTPKGTAYRKEDSLKHSFKRACERAGIKNLRFHDLRHTFGTRGIELTGKLVAVNKILGHSSIQTTMGYVHTDDSLRDTAEKVGNFE
ncbi:site-specific integrase [Desulfobacterota bacterium AH_259_B03_O07]|nr:site-specific integrase [Desulfobacterota bacterium AH_259_B03_O07]